MRYEVIIFDADDTLFDFKKSEKIVFRDTMIEFGLDYDENYHFRIYKEINDGVWKDLELGRITQYELNLLRFQRFCRRMQSDCLYADRPESGLDSEAMADFYKNHLSQASHLYDESISLVQSLYQQYRLTMISNGLREIQENRIKNSMIAKYFEDIVISEEVGVSKPDPRIFEIALDHIGYNDKKKILMVGDSLSSDIKGGMQFGIDTCWHNPAGMVNETLVKPTYEISNLQQLKDLLIEKSE